MVISVIIQTKFKQAEFSNPVYFAPLLTVFPLELGIVARGKKLEWWAIGLKKKFDDIFGSLGTIHEHDRQADRRTDTG